MRNYPNMIIELFEKGANSAIMLKKTKKPKISVRKKRNIPVNLIFYSIIKLLALFRNAKGP